MSRDTDKTFFILSPLTAKYAGLYQQLLSGIVTFEELGNKIIREIRAAHAFRRIEKVRELANLLVNIPVKEYQLIAQYYLVWCNHRESEFQLEGLERIIEQSKTYKSQALSSRAAFEGFRGKVETAMYFYLEALKAARTVSDHIAATLGVAMIKGIEGFHESALKDMQAVIPIIRHAEPRLYFNFHNSYAVELGNVGWKEEARNISRIVLASPLAYAYPEWRETAQGLKEPNRSSVFIDPHSAVPQNVVFMPATGHVEGLAETDSPARVFSMQKWKKRMGKGKKRNEEKPPKDLTPLQIINQIVLFYTNKNTSDEQRYKIWEAVEKIIYPPDSDDSEGA